jgi:hypothetical protein
MNKDDAFDKGQHPFKVDTRPLSTTLHAIKSRVTSIAIVWTDQWVSYVDTLPVIWQHRRNGFKYEIYLYIYLLEAVNPAFEVKHL